MDNLVIRKAQLSDFNNIVSLIDSEFTKEGFGFVNRAQIETEIRKGRVTVAVIDNSIIGVRIGIDTVWNIVVAKTQRQKGIGKALIKIKPPRTIRVKSTPIGHLSKAQKEGFVDPTPFYETLGYKFWGNSYPRNFWQKGKNGKGQFHAKGEVAHIAIYRIGTLDLQFTPEVPDSHLDQEIESRLNHEQ